MVAEKLADYIVPDLDNDSKPKAKVGVKKTINKPEPKPFKPSEKKPKVSMDVDVQENPEMLNPRVKRPPTTDRRTKVKIQKPDTTWPQAEERPTDRRTAPKERQRLKPNEPKNRCPRRKRCKQSPPTRKPYQQSPFRGNHQDHQRLLLLLLHTKGKASILLTSQTRTSSCTKSRTQTSAKTESRTQNSTKTKSKSRNKT